MTRNSFFTKLFGELTMSWGRVLLFALVTGLYTGAVMLIPALTDTSFQDIGIFPDRWLVFAVIIAVNSEKSWESGLKCFLFFLVSQPLVYAVEILFGSLTPALAWQYYRQMWLPMTFLTLPGGCFAYAAKKQTVFGAVILGFGNTVQALLGVVYSINMTIGFPRHLYSALFCFSSLFVMIFSLQRSRQRRLLSLGVTVLCLTALIFFARWNHLYLVSGVF